MVVQNNLLFELQFTLITHFIRVDGVLRFFCILLVFLFTFSFYGLLLEGSVKVSTFSIITISFVIVLLLLVLLHLTVVLIF